MDDQFLKAASLPPDPGFSRSLKTRLGVLESEATERRPAAWRQAFAGALALAAFAALFMLPAVRATAQQMLDLFRVHDFAVVTIDASRVEQLKNSNFDAKSLLGGNIEKLQEPGPPQFFTSIDAATAVAGFAALRPAELPSRVVLDTVTVRGESRERVKVNTEPLRQMMDALNIHDLTIPPGLDGQQISFTMPTLMVQQYKNTRGGKVAFIQAASPEIGLPPGVDLARFGEIGLRVMGLSASEAKRMANSIDWRSTLLVPVASNATRFQQLTVNGAKGLYLETPEGETPHGIKHGPGAVVLWSRDNRIYAIAGNLGHEGLVAMAESVR